MSAKARPGIPAAKDAEEQVDSGAFKLQYIVRL